MNTISNHVVPGTLGRTPVTNPQKKKKEKKKKKPKRVKRTQSKSNLHHNKTFFLNAPEMNTLS